MLTIRRIKVADMVPEKCNPRKKFEGIDRMVDQMNAFAQKPGEPWNPPMVAVDGSKYRIIDGERRWRAMRKIGTEECDAVVAEDFSDEETILAMIATDEKQPLTDAERSCGVQRALRLGVDPEVVEKSARLEKGSAARVKKGMAKAKAVAKTMSIDHLLAIEEFEGDEAAVKALTECDESLWEFEARRIRSNRLAVAKYEAIEAACGKHGVALCEKAPRGSKSVKHLWLSSPEDAEAIVKEIAGEGGRIVVAKRPDVAETILSAEAYTNPADVSDEEAAKIKSDNSVKSSFRKDKKRRAEFVGKKMTEGGVKSLKATGRFFEGVSGKHYTYGFTEISGAEVPVHASEFMIAALWLNVDGMTQDTLLDITHGEQRRSYYNLDTLADIGKTFARFLDALYADGYALSDEEKEFRRKCLEVAGGAKGKGK